MAEKITIKELLNLDQKWFVGQVIEHLEATIDFILKPREVKGQKGTFWSQFIVIKDTTGKIGLDFTAGSEDETIPTSAKGRQVMVEGAKGTVYQDKNNETQRKLSRGKVKLLDTEKPSQGGMGESSPKEDERQYWDHRKDKEQKIITKSALAKSLIESGRKWNKMTQKEADSWFAWIMAEIEIKKKDQELKSEESNEISQAELPEESPQRAALRKTFHGLRSQLVKIGYWNDKDIIGGEEVENDYRNWLDKEFEVPSSTYLTNEEMEKGIKIMAEWLNMEIAKQKGG